jgi:hypothetical protein
LLVTSLTFAALASGVARAEDAPPPPPAADAKTSGIMASASLSCFSPVLGGGFAGPPALQAGPAAGVGVGWRSDWVYVGASYQHVFFGGGGLWEHESTMIRTAAASSDYGGFDLVAFTAPEARVSPMLHAAVGWRVIQAQTDHQANLGDQPASNVDARLGFGVQVRLASLRIVPEASVEIGPLNLYSWLGATAYFDEGELGRM